jgi:hypothetical protein
MGGRRTALRLTFVKSAGTKYPVLFQTSVKAVALL